MYSGTDLRYLYFEYFHGTMSFYSRTIQRDILYFGLYKLRGLHTHTTYKELKHVTTQHCESVSHHFQISYKSPQKKKNQSIRGENNQQINPRWK